MGADLVPLLPAPVYLTDWDFAIKYDPSECLRLHGLGVGHRVMQATSL